VTFGPTASFNFVSDDADVCGVDEAGRQLRALEKFGPCAIHRATFAPVREVGAEHAR